MGAFHIIMSSFRSIVGSFHIIMGAFCITSAGHIIISVFNIPSGQFCILTCANYTIVSGKRNIMGRLVPRHTCLRVVKLNRNQPYNGSPVRYSSGIGIWSFRHHWSFLPT